MAEYFSVPTRLGKALEATSKADGTPIIFTHMAVGDGGGTTPIPSAEKEALVNERWRGEINNITVDPDNPDTWIAEVIIPAEIGGFVIREVGLFTADGILYQYGNAPDSMKPLITEGSAKSLHIMMPVTISHEARVTLLIDPSKVTATRQYVDDEIDKMVIQVKELREETEQNLAALDGRIDGVDDALADHIKATTGIHGATSAATKSRIMARDVNGRAKVAAPEANEDIARKYETDAAAKTAEWASVSGKPSTFTPASHNHAATEITSGTLPIARGGTGNTTGNAATATKLATARAFRTNLASTATANFDGSAACNPGVTGTLPVGNGGTGNTNGTVAKLTTARTVRTNLASTATASFDGSANIAPGVTGVLPIANGGTGASTAAAARTALGISDTAGYELCEFYFFRLATLRTGFQLAQGGLLANAKTLYPKAWEYLVNGAGKALCKTEAEWQTLSKATFATVNGSAITWNGIGGVPWYAPNTSTGALRLPDIRGMYIEAAGFDSLGAGGVHGDAIRKIVGSGLFWEHDTDYASQVTGAFYVNTATRNNYGSDRSDNDNYVIALDSSRVVPAANKNQPRAWGALPCVYLGS